MYFSKYLLTRFSFTFTGHAIHITELVATATVALVGAVHVGALLTARVALALIQIYAEKR